jgi:hypothetical protein
MARKNYQIALIALVSVLSSVSVVATRADGLFVDEMKSLCELAERPEVYDGRSVKVGGVLSWHPHGATFSGGRDCPSERAILRFHKSYSENPAASYEVLNVKKSGGQAFVVYIATFRVLDAITCSPVTFCSNFSIEVRELISVRRD